MPFRCRLRKFRTESNRSHSSGMAPLRVVAGLGIARLGSMIRKHLVQSSRSAHSVVPETIPGAHAGGYYLPPFANPSGYFFFSFTSGPPKWSWTSLAIFAMSTCAALSRTQRLSSFSSVSTHSATGPVFR